MKRVLFVTILYFATSAAFAHSTHVPKHPKSGPPPSQADMKALPKTSVVSKGKHEAPPKPGTTVEQPK